MKENCLRPHFSAHKPNTTTHLRYPRTLPSSWCTCTTTLGSTTRVYHSIACHSLSRVERHRLQIAISQQIAIANTQEASWYYIATVMIMPPSFADTIIQQATTHRKLTIAIPIVTIMKSWHQYISSYSTHHVSTQSVNLMLEDGRRGCNSFAMMNTHDNINKKQSIAIDSQRCIHIPTSGCA